MKKELASNRLIHQYQYELECWGRLLLFQKEELVYFKNRLAEIIDGSTENDLLLTVETFQEAFLDQEKVIDYLSGELKKQAKLIEKDLYFDGEIFRQMQSEQNKLRREFRRAEELFSNVKNRFVQYLVDLY
jgi:hypothetical protein